MLRRDFLTELRHGVHPWQLASPNTVDIVGMVDLIDLVDIVVNQSTTNLLAFSDPPLCFMAMPMRAEDAFAAANLCSI